MYKSPDIMNEIKITKLNGWDTSKMILNKGRRSVGRPKLRWFDDVEADTKTLIIIRWRLKVQDRKESTTVIREVKAKPKWP
jgi:hypothetical protein